ncbi:LpxL/LpxP family acyltransferase, partial [Klebsiella variicola]|uniref:LpxL/LpxP family acyltransferase n=1 Tax=Klebsiella variicola TaxID=244366 RepID=UPI001BD1D0EB
KCFWMDFLNQPSGILFGPEMLANQYDQAVVYFSIHKQKRGHYSMRLKEITSTPRTLEYGEITEQFAKLLEETIKEAPEYWIWSHKRWKRKVPEDLPALREEQIKKFNTRFRSK